MEVGRGGVAGFAGCGHADHRTGGVGKSGQLVVETFPENRVSGPPTLGLSVGQHQHLATEIAGVAEQGDGVADCQRQIGRAGRGRQPAERGPDDIVVDRRRVDDLPHPRSGLDQRHVVAGAEVFEEAVSELDGRGVWRLVAVSPAHAARAVDDDHHVPP